MKKSIGFEKRFENTIKEILKTMLLTGLIASSLTVGEVQASEITFPMFNINIQTVQRSNNEVSNKFLEEVVIKGIMENIRLIKLDRYNSLTIMDVMDNYREEKEFINRLSRKISVDYTKTSKQKFSTVEDRYRLEIENLDVRVIRDVLRNMGKNVDLIRGAKISEYDDLKVVKKNHRVKFYVNHVDHEIRISDNYRHRRYETHTRYNRMNEPLGSRKHREPNNYKVGGGSIHVHYSPFN